MARPRVPAERGFTLIEMMIAVMVIMALLAAMAPVFYGLLRATSSTDYRSVANGIAVQATEQMRSVPYYEVGYYTAPSGCPGSTSSTPPVILDSATPDPMADLATTQLVSGVTFTIQRCVNWVNSSIVADTLAYKRTVVTVSWSVSGISSSVSQTSALYPGGESSYTQATDDYSPDTTTTLASGPPDAPATATASLVTGETSSLIQVTWTASPGAPGATTYDLFYTSGGNPGSSLIGIPPGTEIQSVTSPYDLTVGPGTTYWIQVVAAYGGQTSSPTSAGPVTTTTTTVPCTITGVSVTPSGTSTSQVFLLANSKTNTTGTLQNTSGEFSVSVNDSGSCGVVTAGYNPSACTLITSTTATTTATNCSPTAFVTLTAGSGGSGTLNGATPYGTVWTKGTQDFLVYVNGAIYSPTTEAQSYVCVEAGNSGNCK